MKLSHNHAISQQILDTHPTSFLGLEDLTGIRERTKRKHGKKESLKQRRANRHASRWAFAELRELLTYKAVLAGLVCIRVDADYTSQTCPRCGYTGRDNRPRHGLLFVCQQCQFTLHADLVGSRNICLRTLLIRQDWISTGQLSSAPDVTDDEAKAARLSRYAPVAVEFGHKPPGFSQRYLTLIDPNQFERCFRHWIGQWLGTNQIGHVAIDGKAVRHSFDRKREQSPLQ